jgi:Bifunctional DNA primase/polymerase, N-terminal
MGRGRRLVRAVAGMSHRDAALYYASVGLPVFPCENRGKVPLTRRGFKDASAHREHVWRWWGRWPWANIAIPTGPASGWLVVDLDGAEGLANWRRLCDRYGPVDTLEQRTGNGRHLVFQHPTDVDLANTAGRLGRGIDTRAAGGYVIVAPSVHPSGRLYRWIWPEGYPGVPGGGNGAPEPLRRRPWTLPRTPALAPEWLLGMLLPPKRKATIQRRVEQVPGGGAELVAWLANQSQGNRNAGLYWAACKALERGYGDDVLAALAEASIDTASIPPHTRREAEATVASARRRMSVRG